MSFEALIPLFQTAIGTLIAPLVVLVFSKWYTDYNIRRNNARVKDIIEREIGDHAYALNELNDTVIQYLEKRVKSGSVELDLKLIAVAMTFSWNFILLKLPAILERKEFSDVSVNLSVCFVDSEYLDARQRKISEKGINWQERSEWVERRISEYKKDMRKRFGDRLSCDFRTYTNLPHWHGWLIKEGNATIHKRRDMDQEACEYLILGRTRWVHPKTRSGKSLPKMTVGQNEYRVYTDQTKQGKSRISLFEQWHTYYFDYAYSKKL